MNYDLTKADLKTDEGLSRLGDWIAAESDAALDQGRGALKDRWDQIEAVYRNQPDGTATKLYENYEPRATPVLSSRCDRVVNSTAASLLSPDPWVQFVPDDSDQSGADALERGMHAIMERAGFSRVLRRLVRTAYLCGVAFVRPRTTASGLVLDVVHPADMIVAPAWGKGLTDKHVVGHRLTRPRYQIEELVRRKVYREVELTPTDPDEWQSGHDPDFDRTDKMAHGTGSEKHDLIALYDVTPMIDGNLYRATVAHGSRQVLSVEPLRYPRTWYFDFRLHDEDGGFWPSTSHGYNILGLSLQQSDMFNLLVAGSMASAAPPFAVTGGVMGEQLAQIGLGQYFQSSYPLQFQQVPIAFEPGAMPGLMEMIDNLIDAQTGISSGSMAQEFKSGTTATAAAEYASARALAENSYSMFAGESIEPVWEFVRQMVSMHSDVYKGVYGKALPDEFWMGMDGTGRWQVTGRSPNNAPGVLMGKLSALLQLASDPKSGYSYERVEEQIVNAMQLPFDTGQLRKTEDEKIADIQPQAAAQAALGGAPPVPVQGPGDQGLLPGMDGNGGMGIPPGMAPTPGPGGF